MVLMLMKRTSGMRRGVDGKSGKAVVVGSPSRSQTLRGRPSSQSSPCPRKIPHHSHTRAHAHPYKPSELPQPRHARSARPPPPAANTVKSTNCPPRFVLPG